MKRFSIKRPLPLIAGFLLFLFGSAILFLIEKNIRFNDLFIFSNTDKIQKNGLIHEKSPYLLKHSSDFVDWNPWGDEAFEKAKKRNRPVFLSVGYSACHWCQVMEEESFKNKKIADILNQSFVMILVDREERPDLDAFAMEACVLFTDQCGWPLNLILTPDRKPFYAGTYHPPETTSGRTGLVELSRRAVELWLKEKNKVEEITSDFMKESSQEELTKTNLPNKKIIDDYFSRLQENYSADSPGFRDMPGFVSFDRLRFLFAYHYHTKNKDALTMAESILKKISSGGITDHLGGGLHRYTIDPDFRHPHFEKMLYDQAVAALLYTEAYRLTGNPSYREMSEEILNFISNDLSSPEKGFYTSVSAAGDTTGEDYYTWSREELKNILKNEDFDLFFQYYDLYSADFFSTSVKKDRVKGILQRKRNPVRGNQKSKLHAIKDRLLKHRKNRDSIFIDKKILTDWNSLAISAFAKAGFVFKNENYIQRAVSAENFLNNNAANDTNNIRHGAMNNRSFSESFHSDYSFYVQALLDLYESTFDIQYLKKAEVVNAKMLMKFQNKNHSFSMIPNDAAQDTPFTLSENFIPGIPSAEAASLYSQIRLYRLLYRKTYQSQYADISRYLQQRILKTRIIPADIFFSFTASVFPAYEIVIAGRKNEKITEDMKDVLRSAYLPGSVFVLCDSRETETLEFLKHLRDKSGIKKTTAYVCRNYYCLRPVYTASDLKLQIEPK